MTEFINDIYRMAKSISWFLKCTPSQEQLFNNIFNGKGKNTIIQETWCRWTGKTLSIDLLAAYFAMTSQNEKIYIVMRNSDIKKSIKRIHDILNDNNIKSSFKNMNYILTVGNNEIYWFSLNDSDMIRGKWPTILLVDDFITTNDNKFLVDTIHMKGNIKLYLILSFTKQFEIEKDTPEFKVIKCDFASESHSIVMKNYATEIGDVLKSEIQYNEINI